MYIKNMDFSILKKLGLNDKEIKVYLSLLEHGACSVRGLADISGLNRGTVYDVLKRLQEEGLASYFHQDTKQKFTAEDPEKIASLLGRREEELKSLSAKIKKAIPELKSIQEKGGQRPSTKYYEGSAGIKFILKDLIESFKEEKEKEYYVYSAKNSSEDWKKAYPSFTQDRIKQNIKVKAISLAKGGKTSGLDERKWLGTDDQSATFILIYRGKCAYLSRDAANKPFGVIIENRMIYETQKLIFKSLWENI
jgi:sugar-specific transcriptional regulator TrmB